MSHGKALFLRQIFILSTTKKRIGSARVRGKRSVQYFRPSQNVRMKLSNRFETPGKISNVKVPQREQTDRTRRIATTVRYRRTAAPVSLVSSCCANSARTNSRP